MAHTPNWHKDEGYSCCLTANKGDLAIVICPADRPGDPWEIQVFDEANEEAMVYGQTLLRVELPCWIEEEDAMRAAEQLFF